MDIRDKLADLGITGRKAEVYLTLLQMGSGSVLELAALSGVKRPTVYDLLEDLMAEGLVAESYVGKRKVFAAKNPESLATAQERRLNAAQQLLPELTALFNLGKRKPRVCYYEGLDGLRKVSDDLLKIQSKEYFYFSSAKDILAKFGEEYLRNFVKRRVELGIWSNAIRVSDGEVENADYLGGSEKFLRRLRLMPQPISEEVVSLYVYDNKVAIISALTENYALTIESMELARLIKGIWQSVWPMARKPDET